MSSSAFIRRCGLAAVVAGALFVASEFLDLAVEPASPEGLGTEAFPETAPGALLVFQSGITLIAGGLLLFGLVGLYIHRLEEFGLLGLLGFITALSGTMMAIGGFWSSAFVAPSLTDALIREASALMDAAPPRALSAGFSLSYGLVTAGWFLLGLAALRAGAYPRAAAALLTGGAAFAWLPVPLAGTPFGVAAAWLGYTLYRSVGHPDRTMAGGGDS